MSFKQYLVITKLKSLILVFNSEICHRCLSLWCWRVWVNKTNKNQTESRRSSLKSNWNWNEVNLKLQFLYLFDYDL